jgi:hypothetical protein
VEVRVLFWAPVNITRTAPTLCYRLVRFFVAGKIADIIYFGSGAHSTLLILRILSALIEQGNLETA